MSNIPEVQPFLYFNCLFDAVKTMGTSDGFLVKGVAQADGRDSWRRDIADICINVF
jgi:hypothetical protein